MRKLNAAILGMGYIGASHIDAVRRIGVCRLYAVADADYALARSRAEMYDVPQCYHSIEELVADPNVDVIHDCTPNHLHTQINEAVLRAGKHLLTEKPLSISSQEAESLLAVHREHPEAQAAVNFNYRMNPMVQEMRRRVQEGQLGGVLAVTGCYLQDWLSRETDYSWRLEPEIAGESCCMADIGSHWMDTVQHVTGLRITEVMADFRTVFPVRKKPTAPTQTFSSNAGGAFTEVPVRNEDYASVLFHLSNGAAGAFTVSAVAAGHGCSLQVEVNGSKESYRWNQEENDRLWVGRREGDNSLIIRDPTHMDPRVRPYTTLAKGHPEGWNDAFMGNIRAFYNYIVGGGSGERDFATLEEAAQIVRLTEACVKSSRLKAWVSVDG